MKDLISEFGDCVGVRSRRAAPNCHQSQDRLHNIMNIFYIRRDLGIDGNFEGMF